MNGERMKMRYCRTHYFHLGRGAASWRFQSLVTGLAGLWGGIPQLQKADTRQHGLVAAVAAQAALLGLALSKP